MADLPNVVHVTDDTFENEVINHEGFVLVDFWAAWCGPCKLLDPELKTLAQEQPAIKIAKLNVDENPATAAQFNVMSLPTMMLVTMDKNDEGKRRSVFTMGFRPLPALKGWLKEAGYDTENPPEMSSDSDAPEVEVTAASPEASE